ncbi:uncharacterized protein ACLA_069280 [Aspergillus clavatus NRRL 1]|uniref:Uncharacterized protein n=1 Tax=Aspergillus clavatus (strain ATCC 1007 / CBS 513.65 / DSM 816 / NCTC 3887 / NRRL 1 / QM 1276 / 107) TaxID=344612 RepID=A1C677_ASPCL|nr:uncharacterized protein ACLA_069280 [Aspergillus clavatus NRRL 1]EAW13898.1 conserved hypothetical protein [Aspergillus clavatus NRRL 1]
MDSPRPRNWNQKLFASYLGGTGQELAELRRALTELMATHDKLNKAYKSKAARAELKEFLESNLYRLPTFVQDAGFSATRMDGLMGMAYKIKNEYIHFQQARERQNLAIEPSASTSEQVPGFGYEGEVVEQVPLPEISQPTSPAPINSVPSNDDIVQRFTAVNDTGSTVPPVEEPVVEPPNKRQRTTPSQPSQPSPPQPPQQPDLLSHNIWVLNEVNPARHGLCSMQELLTSEEARNPNHIPRLIDLDFAHWLSIVQTQCGYSFTTHRLEYRPPSTVMSRSAQLPPITIPMSTQIQWRGALNSQLRSKTDQDPVFYLVYKCESSAHAARNVRVPDSNPAGNDAPFPSLPSSPSSSMGSEVSPPRDSLVIKQEYAEEQMRLPGMR